MNKESRIELEITKTLACLDKIENIEAGPFFYNRLRAKIETPAESPVKQMLRPAFLILLVIVNLVTAIVIFQNSGSGPVNRQADLTAAFSKNARDQGKSPWIEVGDFGRSI